MVDEAHKRGIKVAVHTIGPEAAHQAIECHVDDIEHGVQIRDDDLKEMQLRGIVLVPTLFVLKYISLQPDADNPSEWVKQFQLSADTFRRALKANVKIAFGIDSGLEYWRFEQANPVEQIPLMVELGMSPTAAIKTITKNAAELLGLSHELGTIEQGKIADVVAVRGNPLKDMSRLEHIDFVMKAGKVYSEPK
jgi:imidazolonepropionase-like amidohydrolase